MYTQSSSPIKNSDHFDSYFENSLHAVALCNQKNQILKINTAGLALFGYQIEEAEQIKSNILISENERTQFEENYAKLWSGELNAFEEECQLIHKGGANFKALVSAYLTSGEHEQYALIYFQELTGQEIIESEINENKILFEVTDKYYIDLAFDTLKEKYPLRTNEAKAKFDKKKKILKVQIPVDESKLEDDMIQT